jgi:hypothetical protein
MVFEYRCHQWGSKFWPFRSISFHSRLLMEVPTIQIFCCLDLFYSYNMFCCLFYCFFCCCYCFVVVFLWSSLSLNILFGIEYSVSVIDYYNNNNNNNNENFILRGRHTYTYNNIFIACQTTNTHNSSPVYIFQ